MKNIIYVLITLVIIFSVKTKADSVFDNTNFVTGLSMGYGTFSFPEKLDHDITFPNANLTVAMISGQWQASINAGVSLDDATISEEEDVGTASRDDIDFTLGYKVNNSWSVFAGYKSGETKIEFINREDLDEGIAIPLYESYAQVGPYIGVNYSWSFEKAGRLSVSVAYAYLQAENHFRANADEEDDEDEDDSIEFDDLTGDVKADLNGFSYGVTWTMPLSGRLIFQTKLKLNDYQMDIPVDGKTFKNIDQSITSLNVGLAYVF